MRGALKKGNYSGRSVGGTPADAVIQDLIDIIGEEYGEADDPGLEAALCETLDAWTESGQADLAGLARNVGYRIGISGKAANNVMWYLVNIECREGRAGA